ncbi:MAG: helix-turn-helix domain-containing protein [Bacteroidota bacterium]
MQKDHINLKEEDRAHLLELTSTGSLPIRVFKRAMALLELDRGKTLQSVCDSLSVSYPAVSGWRNKYRASGLEFLQDKPRPGRPKSIDGVQRAQITALACSDAPDGFEQWSLRLLAGKAVELGFVEEILIQK